MKKTLPSVYILIAAVLWGCIGLFYKQLARLGFSQLQVVFLRVGIASVGMAIYIAVKDRSWFRIRMRDIWMFIGTGIISLAFFNYCYFCVMFITQYRKTIDFHATNSLIFTLFIRETVYGNAKPSLLHF